MKKLTIFIGMCLLSVMGAVAQTDVTSLYLKNAGFDTEGDYVKSVVYTYASDATANGAVSSCQSVTGWTPDATGDAKAGGAFRYGSGFGLSGTGYVVPAADASGNATGGALGLAGCWGNAVGYSQSVTLPAGTYRISYKVYNAGSNNIANYTNTIGFVEASGTTHYADMEFYAGEWAEGAIFLTLAAQTAGRIHVGYDCANVGSAGTPKLFLDYVKIETWQEVTDYTASVKTDGWGGSGNYTAEGVTGRETFVWAASQPLGERLGQTLTGLPNGVYSLVVYVGASSTSGRDNTANVIADGSTAYNSVHANRASHGVPAYNRVAFTKFDRVELNDIYVSDGTLKISLNQDQTGPNWLVMQVKSLKRTGDLPKLKYTIGDVNEDGSVSIADVTALVNVILGKQEAKVVDLSYTYADLSAMVYAEQLATENASGANYTINSAICPITNEDVRDKHDMKDYLTTLNITTTLSNVVSVSVYAKGKENIAGLMDYNTFKKTVSYSAGQTPSVYVNGDRDDVNGKNMQSDVVTVTGTNAGTYVAYLLPLELSNGVTVTVRDSNGKFYSQDFTVNAGKVNNLTFTETSATNNWMATIPGNVNFSMLSTPGSHNAATSSISSSYAKCQSETIAQQLANGVRAFDLRPQYKSNSTITADNLTVYHGTYSTGVLYKDAIATIVSFLEAHPTEAISIIMTKESASGSDQTSTLVSVVTDIHNQYSSYFKVMDHSYYTLDDFRGKIFYGCRPDWYVSTMTRVTNWPDNTSRTDYSVGVGGTCSASVEDAYDTKDTAKKTVVNALLNLASANTDRSRFHYTFTSVAYKPLSASITDQANTQNPAAASYISGTLTGPAGYVYADFMGSSSYSGAALLKAVINQNYKYVYKGRSRVE